MRPKPTQNHLSAKRHVTLILRLVMDGRGQLEHGEVVDATSRSLGRFVDWDGLTHAVQEHCGRHVPGSG